MEASGFTVDKRRAADATIDDVLHVDGYLFCGPENLASASGEMLEFQPQVREHIGELFGMFGVDSSGFITMAHFVEKVLRPVRPEEGEPPADVTVEPPSWSAAPRPQPARVEMSRVAESSQQQQVELFHQGIRDAQAAQVEEAAARAALPLTLLPALAPYQAPAPAAVTPALSRRSAARRGPKQRSSGKRITFLASLRW